MNAQVKRPPITRADVETAYYAAQIEQNRHTWGWSIEEAIAHQNAQEVTRQPTMLTAEPSPFQGPTAIQASIFDLPEDGEAPIVPNHARYVEGLALLSFPWLLSATNKRKSIPRSTPTVYHDGYWFYLTFFE